MRLHAHRVTDRDMQELQAAGIREDDVFEQTVATAVAACLQRLEAGRRALD